MILKGGNTWAWIAAGTAGTAVIAGSILGGMALADLSELEGMKVNDPGFDDLKSRTDSESLAADVMFGVGAAAAVGALVLFRWDDGDPGAESAVSGIAPLAGEGSVGVAVGGAW